MLFLERKSIKKNLGGACAAGPVVGRSPMTVPRPFSPLQFLVFCTVTAVYFLSGEQYTKSKGAHIMENVQTYLQQAVDRGASDLFIVAGKAVSIKLEGEIIPLQEGRLTPEDSEDAYYATDRHLHEMIVNNCGNARLTKILRTLNGQVEQIRRVASRQPQRLRASRQEHLDIVAALRAGNLERACELLKEHIQNVRNATMSVYLLMGNQEARGNR